jgi:membrane protein DedA with SNARE-associated domain
MHALAFSELWLRHLSQIVSLPWFVLIGSFAEEVISPIPSLLVMGTAGTIAFARGMGIGYLLTLSFVGNIGKTAGAWIYYAIGDALEDIFVPRFGKYFGVTHREIEQIGKRFTGGWKDAVALFLLRVLPFLPTTPVSLSCGIIKMRLSEYLAITFVANFIKDFVYLLVGYAGIAAFGRLWHTVNHIKFFFHVAIAAGAIFALFLLWNHRHKGAWLWEQLCSLPTKKG